MDAFRTAPIAADGKVEDQILRSIERPFRLVARRLVVVENGAAIDPHADPLGRPVELVEVKRIARAGQLDLRLLLRLAHVVEGGGVDRLMDHIGIEADMLMMSISPSSGHFMFGLSASVQIAGQVPTPQGSFARASK